MPAIQDNDKPLAVPLNHEHSIAMPEQVPPNQESAGNCARRKSVDARHAIFPVRIQFAF